MANANFKFAINDVTNQDVTMKPSQSSSQSRGITWTVLDNGTTVAQNATPRQIRELILSGKVRNNSLIPPSEPLLRRKYHFGLLSSLLSFALDFVGNQHPLGENYSSNSQTSPTCVPLRLRASPILDTWPVRSLLDPFTAYFQAVTQVAAIILTFMMSAFLLLSFPREVDLVLDRSWAITFGVAILGSIALFVLMLIPASILGIISGAVARLLTPRLPAGFHPGSRAT